MKEGLENHYNKFYSSEETVFGEGKPLDVVTQIPTLVKSGKVLDIGGGEGRNAMYLADKGFDVEVIDISKVGIDKLKAKAKELGLNLDAKVADIRHFELKENYENIVSSFVFHHLSRDEAIESVEKMKSFTTEGGINIVAAFTVDGDFYRKDPNTDNFYLELGELRKLYTDWEILDYSEQERTAYAKREDGSQMVNVTATILARKKTKN